MANVIEIIVQADIKRLTAGMASAGRAVAAFGKKAAEAGKAVAGLAAPLAKIGAVGAAGFTALAAASVTSAEEIQKQLRGLDSGLDGVSGHMENLRRVALRNGQAISSILPGYLAFQRAVGGVGGGLRGAVETLGPNAALLEDVFGKLQAAARVGGVGQENIATVFEALSDALREGETDADALVATLSQVPALRDIIRRLPIFDGKVTGENALLQVSRELDGIEEKAKSIPKGLGETWENVKTRISSALADSLQKPLESILPKFEEFAKSIAEKIKGIDFGAVFEKAGAIAEKIGGFLSSLVSGEALQGAISIVEKIIGAFDSTSKFFQEAFVSINETVTKVTAQASLIFSNVSVAFESAFLRLDLIVANIKRAFAEAVNAIAQVTPFADEEKADAFVGKAFEEQLAAQEALAKGQANAKAEIDAANAAYQKTIAEITAAQSEREAKAKDETNKMLEASQQAADAKPVEATVEIKVDEASLNAAVKKVYTSFSADGTIQFSDRPGAFADGGAVRGPGGPRQDNLLAWLSNGEYVIPAHAVRHYGEAFFDALRSMRLPLLADGGRADGAAPGGGGLAPVYLTIGGAAMKRPLWADSETVRQLRRAEANA